MGNIIGIGYINLVQHYGWSTSTCFILPAAQAFLAANLVLLFVTTNPVPIDPEQNAHFAAEDILETGSINAPDVNVNGVFTQHLLGVDDEPTDVKSRGDSLHADDLDDHGLGNKPDDEPDAGILGAERAEYEAYGIESDSDESIGPNEYRLSFRNVLRVCDLMFCCFIFIVNSDPIHQFNHYLLCVCSMWI